MDDAGSDWNWRFFQRNGMAPLGPTPATIRRREEEAERVAARAAVTSESLRAAIAALHAKPVETAGEAATRAVLLDAIRAELAARELAANGAEQ
ncbi:MAG: hypothetical protein KGN16_15000 [Burkholderiales bacterium]|nr:hypothetical protein [Burkholderiales bacterium]